MRELRCARTGETYLAIPAALAKLNERLLADVVQGCLVVELLKDRARRCAYLVVVIGEKLLERRCT